MAEKTLYVLHFPDSEPAWLRLEGASLVPADPPSAKSDAVLLALLPDRFFFYMQPSAVQTKNARALAAAARLQMQHSLPPLPEGRETGLLRPVKGRILGFVRRPDLSAFVERHREALARAHTVTTSFILAWHAAQENDLADWTWDGAEGESALAVQDLLFYFRGGPEELANRCRSLLPAGEQPSRLVLADALADLRKRGRKWSQLRLPLKISREDDADLRPLVRTAAVFTLIALLFIVGQAVRLSAAKSRADQWRSETSTLYSQVLGPDLGSDPYGKLLFALDQLNSGGTHGFDVLDCLATLSRQAPDSLAVESMNLSGDSGVLTASVKAYDQLDAFMDGLKAQSRFQFTLDQATNTDKGVKFNLRVAMSK